MNVWAPSNVCHHSHAFNADAPGLALASARSHLDTSRDPHFLIPQTLCGRTIRSKKCHSRVIFTRRGRLSQIYLQEGTSYSGNLGYYEPMKPETTAPLVPFVRCQHCTTDLILLCHLMRRQVFISTSFGKGKFV